MKKNLLILFFLLIYPFSISSNWFYDEGKRQLLYNGQPFITYSSVLTPIGVYYFEKFGDNVYQTYGWFRKTPFNERFSKIDPPIEGQEKGWFIYEGNLDYPYIDGWLYFPEKKLFSKIDVFFKLYRLWDKFYFNIEKLDKNVYNKINKNFYRVETNYLSNRIDYVRIESEDFIVIYQKIIDITSPKYVFIIYPSFKSRKSYYSLKLIYYKDNKIVKTEMIKCI